MNNIQLYNKNFLNSCLDIFRTNIPLFFSSKEEELFRKYLIKSGINYYILWNQNNKLIACGGYEYDNMSEVIMLTWGMVDSQFHHNGHGTSLTDYRLKKIKRKYSKENIVLNTTQKTYQFYQKFGFEIIKITKDYYSLGLDRYDMIKRN